MADSIETYRGYEIVFYYAGRPNVRALIRERGGLPPIHGGPLERSVDAARQKARELIDRRLSALSN